MSTRVETIVDELRAAANPTEHAKVLGRVGDPERVIGVRMKEVFDTAKRHIDADLDDVAALLRRPEYECRMVAVSILDFKARSPKATAEDRAAWCALYLDHHDHIDVWDLVDRSAPRVVGGHLVDHPDRAAILDDLAASDEPMRRRTAITATFLFIRRDLFDDALRLSALLVDDPEPMVRSNVGVALREVGRRAPKLRDAFLAEHADRVPKPVRRVALS
ncbi:MAG: DNA alkylation repair protein [Aeromicrobium sp.]|uniref:DNA alkylation repair protein n=1 Tax=Aeromicrobium sp. TaxID=1871063 RepID=UPI0039E41511